MTTRHLLVLFAATGSAACEGPRPVQSALLGHEPALLVSTLRDHTVQAWALDGTPLGAVVTAASLPPELADQPFEPSSARFVDGELWVSNFATGDVFAFDGAGAFRARIFQNDSVVRIEEPAVIQVSADAVWVLGNDTRNLVDVAGREPWEIAGASWMLRNAHGLALTPDGLAFVGTSPINQSVGLIQLWDLGSGEALSQFGFYGELEEATGLALEPSGTLLVADFFAGELSRWDPASGTRLVTLADEADGLDRPIAVELDADGAAWVLDVAGVVRIDDHVERVVWFDEPDVAKARGLTLGPWMTSAQMAIR